jgi:hypothetical protein
MHGPRAPGRPGRAGPHAKTPAYQLPKTRPKQPSAGTSTDRYTDAMAGRVSAHAYNPVHAAIERIDEQDSRRREQLG